MNVDLNQIPTFDPTNSSFQPNTSYSQNGKNLMFLFKINVNIDYVIKF